MGLVVRCRRNQTRVQDRGVVVQVGQAFLPAYTLEQPTSKVQSARVQGPEFALAHLTEIAGVRRAGPVFICFCLPRSFRMSGIFVSLCVDVPVRPAVGVSIWHREREREGERERASEREGGRDLGAIFVISGIR